jgi:hypothetical protein
MLPAPFHVPAAVILIVGGLLACFAGHRLFRVVLGIYGFILGALVATSLTGETDTASMLIAAGLGGLVGALILILAYFIGVALVGAALGALLANVIWAQLGGDPHPLVVIAFSIAGALGALALQRYVIIVSTAFGGAWTALVGLLALLGQPAAAAAAENGNVWTAYPFNPAQGDQWVIIVWLVLGIVGAIVQLAVTGKARKR